MELVVRDRGRAAHLPAAVNGEAVRFGEPGGVQVQVAGGGAGPQERVVLVPGGHSVAAADLLPAADSEGRRRGESRRLKIDEAGAGPAPHDRPVIVARGRGRADARLLAP